MKKQKASVLVLTLLIMSVVTIFTQQLVRMVFVGVYFVRRMVAREQAEMLAKGGISIAMAQLIVKEAAEKDEKDKDKPIKDFLQQLLPNLNRWQTFELKEDLDGVNGRIQVCITSEHGKFPINYYFDFKQGKFKKEAANILKGLTVRGKLASGMFLKKLTEFLKKRKRKIDDITELVGVPGFEKINVFYNPPRIPEGRKKPLANKEIALQDFFTVWHKGDIDPLLFTDSVLYLLGLRRPLATDSIKIKEKFKKIIENFKKDWGKNWEANWKYLQIIYGNKPALFKDLKGLLSKEFEPRIYSVLSCGIVGGVEQRLLAIIEKQETKSDQKDEVKNKKKRDIFKKPFIVKRIYWL